MQINLETPLKHAIEAYNDKQVQINSIIYQNSLIVSSNEIISDLAIHQVQQIDQDYVDVLLRDNPEIVIIGHQQLGVFPPIEIIAQLSQQKIGLECMSLGAACRTYNILLSEQRAVTAGFIFNK